MLTPYCWRPCSPPIQSGACLRAEVQPETLFKNMYCPSHGPRAPSQIQGLGGNSPEVLAGKPKGMKKHEKEKQCKGRQ